MKKLILMSLMMGSFYSYAQNNVYGKYIKAIDSLDAANIKLSVNTISSTAGGLNIAPLSGQDINFDLVGAGAEIRFNGTASPEVTMALDGTWDFNSNVLTDIGILTVDNITLDGSIISGAATATSGILINSLTTTGTSIPLTIQADVDTDTGTDPAIKLIGGTGSATQTTRPLLTLQNFTTVEYLINADGSHDFNANALLDVGSSATAGSFYETGTFTPVLEFGGGTTGITYSTQSGFYSRVGNQIHVSVRIVLTSKGSSTGSATITGLPFVANSSSAYRSTGAVGGTGFTGLTANVFSQISSNTSFVSLFELNSGSFSSIQDSNFGATTTINFSINYMN